MKTVLTDNKRRSDNIAIMAKLPTEEVYKTYLQARENGDTELMIDADRELISRKSEEK